MTSFPPSGGVFDLKEKKKKLAEIEARLSQPKAWDNPEALTPILQEKRQLEETIAKLEELKKSEQDVQEWLALAEEEQTQEVFSLLKEHLDILEKKLQQAEMETLLAGPEDKSSAILEIHPGAGGTEAQDWAEMLLRMYTRWAERKGFKIDYLDYLPGDEAGVKSVTIQVNGLYAYGLLKGEKGIHRLIRISPFDASGRRHTSFASVDVYPQVSGAIEIDIREEDLRIEAFRASGPGGQHVNKTSSAIRITHLPTGIVVQCQNERSQRRNKDSALKILKAKLYEIEIQKINAEKQAEYASKEAIAWGSQIRTYTLHPYRLVKDHRVGTEISDVDAVLDGELDELMRNYLLFKVTQ